ncbi:MAG: divalent metal cation transporter [Pseudomonadota bacterium]
MGRYDSKLLGRLGPGILFAGAAIGTSHLVQSTRAGALFGLGFLGVIVLANVVKYPAFRIGPLYAAVTGESLLAGYARLGHWVVVLTALGLVPIQAIILAATAITSAGIALALLNMLLPLGWDAQLVAVSFLVLAVLLARVGGFGLLQALTKFFIATLTITTLLATILALPEVRWDWTLEPLHSMEVGVFLFAVAVMGFMPAGIDLALIQSLWTLEKRSERALSVREVAFDFHVGYIGSALLAVCFMLMGAGVMAPEGVVPATAAPAFAAQVLGLYTSTLGEWSGVVVGISALAVMFSTLLAVVDGMPRVQAACLQAARRRDRPVNLLAVTLGLVGIAALVLLFFMSSFAGFIDFVTTTTFLVGPLIALLNHLVMTRAPVPVSHRLQGVHWYASGFGIGTMSVIAIAYFYFYFF